MAIALIPIKVSIGQFYGIEINDFAVTVAKTALWIAESQMMKETTDIIHHEIDFLPLKSYANITAGNALRMDWEEVVPKDKLNYIMGNPPFIGYSLQSKEQKEDIRAIYVDEKGKPYKTAGKIDYVSGWYFKAAQMMEKNTIHTAFVSTNSITQGEQVAGVWKPLYERFNVHIDFAHRTFIWNSEANDKAHVHCVIVGYSTAASTKPKKLFSDDSFHIVENINAYLTDAPDIFIESRKKPLCNALVMTTGNRPADGGHLIIEANDYDDFIAREPQAKKYIKQLTGATEFINNKERWCLWLVDANISELRKMPLVLERIEACKQDRLNSPDKGRQKLADTPMIFRETINPSSYIIVPRVSSERRRYIPLGFLDDTIIPTDSATIIENASNYEFGILTSNIHMAWMRAVAGRLKSDYRYSKDIVYNNFPWPHPTEAQKAKIEETAQGFWMPVRNMLMQVLPISMMIPLCHQTYVKHIKKMIKPWQPPTASIKTPLSSKANPPASPCSCVCTKPSPKKKPNNPPHNKPCASTHRKHRALFVRWVILHRHHRKYHQKQSLRLFPPFLIVSHPAFANCAECIAIFLVRRTTTFYRSQ